MVVTAEEVVFTVVEAMVTAADTSTAAIMAVDTTVGAGVTTAGVAAIGATLVTVTDGDSVLALVGGPIGRHIRIRTRIARGGSLLTITLTMLLTMFLPATRPLTTVATTLPHQILARTLTTTPR